MLEPSVKKARRSARIVMDMINSALVNLRKPAVAAAVRATGFSYGDNQPGGQPSGALESICVSGEDELTGDVTLSAAGTTALTQSGQNIEIDSGEAGYEASATLTDNAQTAVTICSATGLSKVHLEWDAKHNDRRECGSCDIAIDGGSAYIVNRLSGSVGAASRVIKAAGADISSGNVRFIVTTDTESTTGTIRITYTKVATH